MSLKEYIESRFDVDGLRECGLLTTQKTPEEIAKRICRYFGMKSIYEYDMLPNIISKPIIPKIDTFSKN
jgi:hypothetical protein